MKRLFLILLSITGSLQLGAQSLDRWTLEECLEYAVERSLSISSLEMQGLIVREDYRQAIASLFPSLSASTGASFNFGRSLDPDTNTYTLNQNSFSNSYGADASLTLFNGFASINRIRLEKVNRAKLNHDVSYRRDMVAYETMEAFLQVQFDMEMAELTREQLAESELNLSQTVMMEELGLKGMPDVVEMEAKVAADRFNYTRQKNQLAISVILLKEKMNYPIADELAIEPYGTSLDAERIMPSAEELFTNALDYNPRALSAESSYRTYEIQRKITRANLMPTISAGGGWSTGFARPLGSHEYDPYKKQFSGKHGYYTGFSLSIPLFGGLSRIGSVRKSNFQLRIAQNERDAELRSLYSDIAQAVTDATGQADEYRQALKQAEAMRLAHEVNKRKYDEGLISVLDFHTSSNRSLEAQIQEKQSEVRLYLKQRLVAYYAGVPLIKE